MENAVTKTSETMRYSWKKNGDIYEKSDIYKRNNGRGKNGDKQNTAKITAKLRFSRRRLVLVRRPVDCHRRNKTNDV